MQQTFGTAINVVEKVWIKECKHSGNQRVQKVCRQQNKIRTEEIERRMDPELRFLHGWSELLS